jgi:hypothetical protein
LAAQVVQSFIHQFDDVELVEDQSAAYPRHPRTALPLIILVFARN